MWCNSLTLTDESLPPSCLWALCLGRARSFAGAFKGILYQISTKAHVSRPLREGGAIVQLRSTFFAHRGSQVQSTASLVIKSDPLPGQSRQANSPIHCKAGSCVQSTRNVSVFKMSQEPSLSLLLFILLVWNLGLRELWIFLIHPTIRCFKNVTQPLLPTRKRAAYHIHCAKHLKYFIPIHTN